MSLRKIFISFSAALLALGLTSCAQPPPPSPDGSWIATSAGDVHCFLSYTYAGYTITDCDWSTLTDLHSHTDKSSSIRQLTILDTFSGKVPCIVDVTYAGYAVNDCDWSRPQK